ANESYTVTFTNRVVIIDYPTFAVGKIYKGPENAYNTPKDPVEDSVNAGQYFNNPNSPGGRSRDTIYLTVTYYDQFGNKQETPEFWYPFMDPPVGSGDYFEFYVPVDDQDTGYFTLRLSLYNRSPNRPGYSNNHGRWYMEMSIELLEIIGYAEGKAPAMNPPAPPYTPARLSLFSAEENLEVAWGWYWDWNLGCWVFEDYDTALAKLQNESVVIDEPAASVVDEPAASEVDEPAATEEEGPAAPEDTELAILDEDDPLLPDIEVDEE
ncbi:MAG: hypothetical protein LBU61_01650, partial [Coriobacteriales bacterium]|nr:hypothetical protein [Coriobacteriales bacterium]